MNKAELFRNRLLGLAVTDTLRTTLEFRAPGTFRVLTAVDACGYFGALPRGAVNGADRDELLFGPHIPILGHRANKPIIPKIADIVVGLYKHKKPLETKGTNSVVNAPETALSAFRRSSGSRRAAS